MDEDEPEVLFVACHHCREIVTPEIGLDIIGRLTTGYGSDPAITALVDQYEIWVAPVCNPDGLEYVWNVNNLWRKNRKDFGNGEFGVDLNRNYDLNWQSLCGASNNPTSNVYRGPSPQSEAEVQTIVGLSQARNFAKVMDFHSYGQEVLQGYNCAAMPSLIDTWIDNEAAALANPISFNTRDPSADGEHYQWQIKASTAYAFLAETHTSFQPTHPSALTEAAAVWPMNLAFLQRPLPLVGHVTDASTGAPVAAGVSIVGLTWSNGETRRSEPQYGRYHLNLPAGTHQVQFDAPGYAPQTVTVTTTGNGTTVQDVMLMQGGPFALAAFTSGGGVGDFTMDLYNLPPGTGVGFTLFSLQTAQPVGTGGLFGLAPDLLTIESLVSPPGPTNPLHWSQPFVPGVFPLGPLTLPPGTVQIPAGTRVDGVAIAATPAYLQLLAQSSVVRLTF
ncbi:MAG: carboxypeptidase regulatory-like domain-containing protein [Planctomycetes bacterium]|nr:carboxypeptidase regulatory-like domain-containing protein [Planctomycetota bacterium]